uniref:Protein SPIRAL1-like 1 n=1 Tax=Noccaea caerulescens TaxID=107243 RepID=A0A1J3EWF3_NOCCA
MGRGVSAGGGQSSLGYLFGSGEAQAPKPATNNAPAPPAETLPVANADPSPTPAPVAAQPVNVARQIPAGTNNSSTNNYIRADGQNTGNFLTDRPSTKVHAPPGGGSSLDYLLGGGGSN